LLPLYFSVLREHDNAALHIQQQSSERMQHYLD